MSGATLQRLSFRLGLCLCGPWRAGRLLRAQRVRGMAGRGAWAPWPVGACAPGRPPRGALLRPRARIGRRGALAQKPGRERVGRRAGACFGAGCWVAPATPDRPPRGTLLRPRAGSNLFGALAQTPGRERVDQRAGLGWSLSVDNLPAARRKTRAGTRAGARAWMARPSDVSSAGAAVAGGWGAETTSPAPRARSGCKRCGQRRAREGTRSRLAAAGGWWSRSGRGAACPASTRARTVTDFHHRALAAASSPPPRPRHASSWTTHARAAAHLASVGHTVYPRVTSSSFYVRTS
jgi:hypothetical protein